mmetsp:Transcript_37458/g.123573  ORF Transcript_37458/g.123573 Transcript_37458/m.123573 type:complete len:210 (-) Transcript_37458:868-1497(-)
MITWIGTLSDGRGLLLQTRTPREAPLAGSGEWDHKQALYPLPRPAHTQPKPLPNRPWSRLRGGCRGAQTVPHERHTGLAVIAWTTSSKSIRPSPFRSTISKISFTSASRSASSPSLSLSRIVLSSPVEMSAASPATASKARRMSPLESSKQPEPMHANCTSASAASAALVWSATALRAAAISSALPRKTPLSGATAPSAAMGLREASSW